jgi:hypothetical protein
MKRQMKLTAAAKAWRQQQHDDDGMKNNMKRRKHQ